MSGELNFGLKIKYSFYSALGFFLVASPETYKFMQQIFGSFITIASSGGCPTTTGFFIHTFVFFLAMVALMMFPRDKN
jgi:hypothetical protein